MQNIIILIKIQTTLESFSSTYKANDLSNIHGRVFIIDIYNVFKCPEVQSSVHPLILFSSDKNKSKRFCTVKRSPYLVFGMDTGVAGSLIFSTCS